MNNKYQQLIKPRLPELAGFLNSGKTAAMAAKWLGVSESTLRRCRKQHPELEEIFKQRKELFDDMVEAALLKRATGYEDSSGKEIAPDVRAALFWLQNRRPKRWKKVSNSKAKNAKTTVSIQLSPLEAEL